MPVNSACDGASSEKAGIELRAVRSASSPTRASVEMFISELPRRSRSMRSSLPVAPSSAMISCSFGDQ
eukprot:1400148-Pleurochrysis_carterae.AAC.4